MSAEVHFVSDLAFLPKIDVWGQQFDWMSRVRTRTTVQNAKICRQLYEWCPWKCNTIQIAGQEFVAPILMLLSGTAIWSEAKDSNYATLREKKSAIKLPQLAHINRN